MDKKEENVRPPYPRGSGLRVTICHEEDERARYYVAMNKGAGNPLYVDEKGFIFTLVCRYNMCYSSDVSERPAPTSAEIAKRFF